MLPSVFDEWIIFRPKTQEDIKKDLEKHLEMGYSKEGYFSFIKSYDESIKILDNIGIRKDTSFYEFYSTFTGIDSSEQQGADLMYSLEEILEDYKQPYWGDKYPGIQKRYLQLSSIEGEYSYFYDKETDALYGVDWGEMEDFINGKLKPLFTSFYDFLEWYYSEEEEE